MLSISCGQKITEEELKALTVFYDCGTPRIFEDGKYQYVFRTASHAVMDNVALARYLKSHHIRVNTINYINQDYAWGHDSRSDFKAATAQLFPGVKSQADLLPKFGAGQYGTEISALLSKPADITHSSLWGGDLEGPIPAGRTLGTTRFGSARLWREPASRRG